MIDLKRYVKRWTSSSSTNLLESIRGNEELEGLFELALGCYCAAIDSVAEHTPDTPRALRDEHRRKLRQLRNDLECADDRQSLADGRKHLDTQLRLYGRSMEKFIHESERDVKDIMTMMATMADTMGSREKQYNVRFKGIAKQLRLLTTSTDLAEIRHKLAAEIDQLEKYLDEMSRDTQEALNRVKSEAEAHEIARSVESWVDAAVDPLTQCAGRPGALSAIDGLKADGARFCLARFSLANHATLRERHGKPVIDSVLKETSHRLRDLLREATVIARWTESDFVAIVEVPLADFTARMAVIERKLALTFTVPGRDDRIVVACQASAVQPMQTESALEMVQRCLEKSDPVLR